MKIIIKLKPSATLARIESFSACLGDMKDAAVDTDLPLFGDVIESITAEKE